MTVLVDSVLLGGTPALRTAMPGWTIAMRGRPALMLRAAEHDVRGTGRVERLVVIGLGYNTLWERNRNHYRHWSRQFDREADQLLRTLRSRGARKFVWVTLRQPTVRTVPRAGLGEMRQYAWYFPYVNERLRRLAKRNDDLVLAGWRTAGDRPGVTYDAIHLNPRGARLMARTIERVVRREAHRYPARHAG